VLDRRQPLHQHALFERLLDLEVVRRHAVAGATVDDDRLAGAQALGGARSVHRRVPAAVDDDAPAEQRRRLALHVAQQRDRVEDVCSLSRGDVGALADVGADSEEGSVEFAALHLLEDVGHLRIALELHAEVEDARDLGVQDLARQAVARDAEAHHAAGHRSGLADRDGVPATR
jgi:hypothetical protein